MGSAVAGERIIPLVGEPASVGRARALVGAWLHKWEYDRIIDDAVLVVSELVTNAVRRTPDEEVYVHVKRDGRGVVIAVWDGDAGRPCPRECVPLRLEDFDVSEGAFDDNGGRGLHIVRALSVEYGTTEDPAGGKWVWARMLA